MNKKFVLVIIFLLVFPAVLFSQSMSVGTVRILNFTASGVGTIDGNWTFTGTVTGAGLANAADSLSGARFQIIYLDTIKARAGKTKIVMLLR